MIEREDLTYEKVYVIDTLTGTIWDYLQTQRRVIMYLLLDLIRMVGVGGLCVLISSISLITLLYITREG